MDLFRQSEFEGMQNIGQVISAHPPSAKMGCRPGGLVEYSNENKWNRAREARFRIPDSPKMDSVPTTKNERQL